MIGSAFRNTVARVQQEAGSTNKCSRYQSCISCKKNTEEMVHLL